LKRIDELTSGPVCQQQLATEPAVPKRLSATAFRKIVFLAEKENAHE
jgi:hypothetical protein